MTVVKMIRAVLVDLDGTLADTKKANIAAYRHALNVLKLPYKDDSLISTVGQLAWRPMLEHVLPNHSDLYDKIIKIKRSVYFNYLDQVFINDSLVQILRILKKQIPIALVTSASKSSVTILLAHKNLNTLFDLTITSDDVEHQKPNPQAYELAAARLKVSPEECIIMEDSAVGITAAKAFGSQIWQVHWSENFTQLNNI